MPFFLHAPEPIREILFYSHKKAASIYKGIEILCVNANQTMSYWQCTRIYLSMTIMYFYRHGNELRLHGLKSKYESTLSAIVFFIFASGDGSLRYYLMSAKWVNNVLESLMV